MSPCCISATNTKSLISAFVKLLNSADFHFKVVDTICKMNTMSKDNRKRKSKVEEGIEEKTERAYSAYATKTRGPRKN